MKKFFYLFASLAVVAACATKGEEGGEGTEPVVDPTLSVTATSIEFVAEGESKTFKLTTNNDWTVTTEADWLEIAPRSGAAATSKEITVTAGANETAATRTAVITVKADVLTKTINVSQDNVVVTPSPDPDPTPGGNTTQYQRGTDPVMYAAGLQDGKYYVMYLKASDLSSDDPK